MTTQHFYAVILQGQGIYGAGETREAAIADAARWVEPEIDDETGEATDPLDDIPYIGRPHEIPDGTFYVTGITPALFKAIHDDAGEALSEAHHRCVTGLLDRGAEADCPLCADASHPDEGGDMQGYLLTSLTEDRNELQRRVDAIDAQIKAAREEGQQAKDQAAAAWLHVLVSLHHAWITHKNYAANNMPAADKERVADITPANVLETARRRHYVPDWMTPAHVYRAMQEIDGMIARGEWHDKTANLLPRSYR